MHGSDTAKSRYMALAMQRSAFEQRARDCAKYTIPSIFPPEGFGATSKLVTPWQSVGARGVNNLSAKLLLSLMPPNSPFFTLKLDDFKAQRLGAKSRGAFEQALDRITRAVTTEFEATATRVKIHEVIRLLVVTGNALLFCDPEGGARTYRLDNYVVRRDDAGHPLLIILKDDYAPESLPAEVREFAKVDAPKGHGAAAEDKRVSVFTVCARQGDQWDVWQECNDVTLPGGGTYPIDRCPMLALRFSSQPGEDYGRSYVEEYLGDLISLEGLSRAIVEGAAIASKTVWLVRPNSTTRPSALANAPNGAIVEGSEGDVTVVQANRAADLRAVQEVIQQITQRLAYAFLMNQAVQRPGDRVTAEEIRIMAQDLETALGGIYSLLAVELQLPLVNQTMWGMEQRGILPPLPKGDVKPAVVTGIEALGRGNDLNKLDLLISGSMQALGAEAVAARVDVGEYISRRAAALGIDTQGLILSDAQIQQQQQQAQMQQMIEKLGPNAINAFGKIAGDQLANKEG
jgi:hypothetical protein